MIQIPMFRCLNCGVEFYREDLKTNKAYSDLISAANDNCLHQCYPNDKNSNIKGVSILIALSEIENEKETNKKS